MEHHNQQRIDVLISFFLEGKISPAEHEELLALLALPEHEDKARMFLADLEARLPNQADHFSAADSARLHASIMDRITIRKPWIRRLPVALRVAAAASVVFGLTYLFLFQSGRDKPLGKVDQAQSQAFVADVAPGGNRATLKLANNRLIVLDKVEDGMLVNAGNLRVRKEKGGKVVFEVNNQVANGNAPAGENVLTTPAGGQYEVRLPDGSRVWLNASSSLRFPSVFVGNKRQVALSGEGYFEVSKSKDKRFIVQTQDARVEVLGTHFNINAYPDERELATTLLEGSVRFSHPSKSVLLKPREQARLKNGRLDVQTVDVDDVIAWKNGYFIFDNEEIHSVMRKLSRWYNVAVEYEDPNVNEEFAGTISRFNNITEILKLLEATGTIKFKILPSRDPNYERRVVVMK